MRSKLQAPKLKLPPQKARGHSCRQQRSRLTKLRQDQSGLSLQGCCGQECLRAVLVYFVSILLLLALFVNTSRGADGVLRGAYATGNYRNLFVEAGFPAPEVQPKIDSAFAQLFHGNVSNETVYYPAGNNSNGPLAYILDTANRDVRSEGMSYGLMIAVQMDKKREFDALWNWAYTFMHHSSTNHPAFGYFSWSMRTNGFANDEMPAPDGEEYLATALYFASSRWGDGTGIYDYKAQADKLVSDLKNRSQIRGRTISGVQTGRALFDGKRKMVRFTADVESDGHTDPSYHLPAFYDLWSHCGPVEDRAFWREAAAASRDYFQRVTHPTTALAPDYANFDGTPWASPRNRNAANFSFDAWRVAMNWSVDWSWWEADAHERELSDRLLNFFDQGFPHYGNQFTLDGQILSNDHSIGLVAMNATAALAATQPHAKKYVTELWNAPVPAGTYRYYDGMLYLIGMLHCSGEFRIWAPRQLVAHQP